MLILRVVFSARDLGRFYTWMSRLPTSPVPLSPPQPSGYSVSPEYCPLPPCPRQKIANSQTPASGSLSFKGRLFNFCLSWSLPHAFKLCVYLIPDFIIFTCRRVGQPSYFLLLPGAQKLEPLRALEGILTL